MTRIDKREEGEKVFRKLNSFLQMKLPVHFKLVTGEFRNGEIIDLSYSKLTLVLKEDVLGTLPILLEDIDDKTIAERRKKE